MEGLFYFKSVLRSCIVLASNFANMTTKTRTYGRGILRFTSWEPCRIPGQIGRSSGESSRRVIGDHVSAVMTDTSQLIPTANRAHQAQNGGKQVQLLAKYNYKANPDRPGGFDELSITQGEKMEFCRKHPTNPHWWEARNSKGDVGFVPATYMMVLENNVSSLPWLEERKQQRIGEDEKEIQRKFGEPTFKPYKSAYTDDGKSISSGTFYCDICGKDLNGPIPYKMHLNSKAHKEEVALREEYSQ